MRTKQKIEYLHVHDYSGNVKGTVITWDRKKVIDYIESNYIFYTMYDNSKLGEQTQVIHADYGKYLRTDKNQITRDNLDRLPEF